MQVHFIGSQAGFPTALNATTGLVLEYPGGLFVFDAPEGAQQLLMQMKLSLNKIRAIFVTHLHMDHVAGLVPLIQSICFADPAANLTVFGPPGVKQLIEVTHQLTYAQRISPNMQIVELSTEAPTEFALAAKQEYVFQIKAIPLAHVVPVLGYYLVQPQKRQVSMKKAREAGFPFGLETLRFQKFEDVTIDGKLWRHEEFVETEGGLRVLVAFDCNLEKTISSISALQGQIDYLITECTFPEEMQEMALQTGHSTPGFVQKAADALNVQKVVLCHFSNRFGLLKEHAVPSELQWSDRLVFPQTRQEVSFQNLKILQAQQVGSAMLK